MPTPDEAKARRREASRKLAAAMNSPWEPGCVARAFATPGRGVLVYRYQTWIDLEAVRSPLLLGLPPKDDAQADAAFRAFGLEWRGLSEDEAVAVVQTMLEAINEPRTLLLRMQPEQASTLPDQGFGAWLPTICRLVEYRIALNLREALRLPVVQGDMALACMRANEGWTVKGGTPFKWRDAEAEAEGQSDNRTTGQSEGAAR